jgi:uncharacterized protein (DUF1015 family)
MANVRPFRGITYDLDRIDGDLAGVTTPPYDQINAAGVEAFHQRNEYSYIRLILARQTAQDTDDSNRYTRARDTLEKWRAEGVLKHEDHEAFYVYRQTFRVLGRDFTRTGLMTAVHWDDPDNGVILRHERTLPKHVDDRLNLLRRTRTQFESIFLLYDDPEGVVQEAQRNAILGSPHLSVVDEVGTQHEIWRLDDAAALPRLRDFFKDRTLLIADGHHRYQTTGMYAAETGHDEDAWVLATLYSVDDPGLVILPTHRVVKNVDLFVADKLWRDLEVDFFVEPWDGDGDSLVAHMREKASAAHVFGLFEPSKGFALLTLRDEATLQKYVPEGNTLDWMKLDVAILHRVILEGLLDITPEKVSKEGSLEYFRWPQDAVATVRAGNAQAVFFLNATQPTQVRDLASKGELMPQKSTDFYPKLLSGLVAFPLEPVTSGVTR